MNKHPKKIEKYNGTMEELSRDIVGLDYDAQVELFKLLTKDFQTDSINDQNIGHPKVSKFLENISSGLSEILKRDMEPMADLCRTYNKKGIR
ncbi:MAG TPA: hypothetical protein VJ892_02200 [Candidatus Absconditabacterales bacterium]|nr:hypothetical protein [Candidatus Absconditabacterales bacterium]